MRSASALSALLLLLLPLASLSQDDTQQPTESVADAKQTSGTSAAAQSTTAKPAAAGSPAPQSTTAAPTSRSPVTTAGGPATGQGAGGVATTSAPTTTPAPGKEPGTTGSQGGAKSTTQAGAQSAGATQAAATQAAATQGASPTQGTTGSAPQASPGVATPGTTSVPPPSATPTGPPPQPMGPGPTTPAVKSTEAPYKPPATASSGPGATSGHPGTAQGTPPTTEVSSVTFQGNQQVSSTKPAITGTSPSVPQTSPAVPGTSPGASPGTSPPEALKPAASSSGPVATRPVGPTSPSVHLAPTPPPQASNIPYPTSAYRDRVSCEPPASPDETMLLLNLTTTSLCAKSPPDDKLVTLLCRAAKANFNPSQGWCQIRLVPVPESQAVAVKEITVQTNLLPKDVYELLKDKWDDLKEVGVSDMQLGGQGPPEETEDRFSMPLIITIVCMASFLLLVAALYGCCHQRLSQRKDQQRLTEELQTVENGYHDNPTLEVMETLSEMQEKKVVNLNGELGDSWIVPLDNLIKDDLDEEEDTHL